MAAPTPEVLSSTSSVIQVSSTAAQGAPPARDCVIIGTDPAQSNLPPSMNHDQVCFGLRLVFLQFSSVDCFLFHYLTPSQLRQRASREVVTQWVAQAWELVSEEQIKQSFRVTGIVGNEEEEKIAYDDSFDAEAEFQALTAELESFCKLDINDGVRSALSPGEQSEISDLLEEWKVDSMQEPENEAAEEDGECVEVEADSEPESVSS